MVLGRGRGEEGKLAWQGDDTPPDTSETRTGRVPLATATVARGVTRVMLLRWHVTARAVTMRHHGVRKPVCP